ncbi:MAG: hypothetical protein LPK85_10930, partial [Gammaproteobacteria bacterium]|nr:hypothetical protein [Gammaproteobacteria bacterium]
MRIEHSFNTTHVYNLYHPDTKHYFMTADINEFDTLKAQGWHVADQGFRAWPANGAAPSIAKPVCRFYSHLVNSHFYTASNDECEYLKNSNSGWIYEGIAFKSLVATAGACTYGTNPILRLYNDRAAEMDSNHRFVTSESIYHTMISDDWIGEGVAFCAPN